MRTKRETKNNVEISQAFNINRFLWPFATQYMKAKSEGNLDRFWASTGSTLESFDQKHPTCQRDSATIDLAKVGDDLTLTGEELAKVSHIHTSTGEASTKLGHIHTLTNDGSAKVGHMLTSTGEGSAMIGPQTRSNPGTSSPSTAQESKRAQTAQPSKNTGSATLSQVSPPCGHWSRNVSQRIGHRRPPQDDWPRIIGHPRPSLSWDRQRQNLTQE
jgi:hypothetical protein